jgi:pimeloyl-ACP methyl ester carboxylesterase
MRSMLTNLLVLGGIAVALYVALCLFLYLQQERILFYPGPNDSALLRQWAPRRLEIASGEHRLEGWWAENPDSSSPCVAIYFGGNAEDVLYTASTAHLIDARRMLFVNYRGYGRTHGKPSQRALYQDAIAIYDHVLASGAAKGSDIIVMGRSLGSSLAAMLAAKREVRGAILITPFDSINAVAAGHYPLFPVRLLLKHPFDSVPFAKQATAPALFIAAEHDTIIPPIHARRLHDIWSGPKRFHLLTDVGHNDLERHPDYYPLINTFLAQDHTR